MSGRAVVAEAFGYSKNRVTDETIQLLGALAEQSGVPDGTEAVFAGEHINVSEDRAVLHVPVADAA